MVIVEVIIILSTMIEVVMVVLRWWLWCGVAVGAVVGGGENELLSVTGVAVPHEGRYVF